MAAILVTQDEFSNRDFTGEQLSPGDYEDCTFTHCLFYETDLSGFRFTRCRFDHCNLSMVRLKKTGLDQLSFHHCKMLGIRFDECNALSFSASFDHCTLDYSSFHQLNMPSAQFDACSLREVDFTKTRLMKANFAACDLKGASFEQTNLESANFLTAVNYIIDPENNSVRKARFSSDGLGGLLTKYGIEID